MKYSISEIHPIKHFRTITHHRHQVMINCIRAGIGFQGMFHDLSKYMPEEFIAGALHYQGTRSPNEGEREEYGYSKAWMHHKGRNKHHFEYWTDYSKETRQLQPVLMPKRYVIEMFCDRMAASQTYNGKNYKDTDPLNYFLGGKKVRVMHPMTEAEIEIIIRILALEGSSAAFSYTRRWLKSKGHMIPRPSSSQMANKEIAELYKRTRSLTRKNMMLPYGMHQNKVDFDHSV